MARLSKGSNKARYSLMLVDTGADISLISRSFATLLGINYAKIKTKTVEVETASLEKINARKIKINIEIGDEKFEIPIFVANGEVEALLGRKGVFEHFEVTFKETKQEVIFKRIND